MRKLTIGAFGRARVVALQASAGALLTGFVFGGPTGWTLAVAGALTGIAALLRHREQWLDARLLAGWRRGGLAGDGRRAPDAALGLAATLLPPLEVAEASDRNGRTVGVLADGRGHAAVLELPPGVLPSAALGLLGDWLTRDAARPAAVQLLVEQFGLPSWDFHQRFEPTMAYRQLPAQARPVAVRSHLVVRYEPWDAPEVAESRGGGALGARTALTAATARLGAYLARLGVPTRTLDAEQLRELLRDTGDTDGEGRTLPDSWAGAHRTHCSLAVRLDQPEDWHRLLAALAGTGMDRTVAAVTVDRTARGVEARAAVRLVSGAAQRAAEGRDRLVTGGAALPLTGAQSAGLVATLPLAHPARPLEAATGFAPDTDRRHPTTGAR